MIATRAEAEIRASRNGEKKLAALKIQIQEDERKEEANSLAEVH